MIFIFFLTDPSVEHIMKFIKHTYGIQKDGEQKWDTYEDHMWAINYNLKTFLKSSNPFVLFISDMSLVQILVHSHFELVHEPVTQMAVELIKFISIQFCKRDECKSNTLFQVKTTKKTNF